MNDQPSTWDVLNAIAKAADREHESLAYTRDPDDPYLTALCAIENVVRSAIRDLLP